MDIKVTDQDSYIGGQPHEAFDWLRMHQPVYYKRYTEEYGLWLLTRYEDIYEVNKDFERFSSEGGVLYPHNILRFAELEGEWARRAEAQKQVHEIGTAEADVRSQHIGGSENEVMQPMLEMDPPRHTEYRKLIRKEMSKKSAEEYRQRAAFLAKGIVDEVIASGRCDFAAEVAGKMAGCVTADALGLPIQDSSSLYKITEVFHSADGALSPAEMCDGMEFLAWYAQKNRRAETLKSRS